MEEEKAVDPRNSSEVSSTDTPRAPEHRRSAGHGKNVSTRIFSKQCKKLRSLLVALSSSLLRIRRDTGVPPCGEDCWSQIIYIFTWTDRLLSSAEVESRTANCNLHILPTPGRDTP